MKPRDLLTLRSGFVLLAVLALFGAACGTDSDDGGTSSAGTDRPSFQVVSFNAGLARGFVDYSIERSADVTDAISQLEAEVIAVQEVWNPQDVQTVLEGTAETHPFSLFVDPQPELNEQEQTQADAAGVTGPPCPANEALPLEDCARKSCDGLPDDQLSDCVLQSCGTEFAATCPECQTCLAANIGGSLDEILTACAGGEGGGSFAYDGAFGIGIISTEPFLEQDSLVLASSLNRRGVLYVQIDDPVLGVVDIFNTHLSANLDLGSSPVPYPGEGSWAEEQAAQIEVATEWIDERTSDERVAIFVGDMNTSPEGENHSAETPDNYELLVSSGGWDAPYVDAPGAECTYCDDNLLVGGETATGPVLDHILIRNFDGEVDTERIFTDPIEIEVEGRTEVTHLSDHYGLRAILTPS